MRIIRFLKLVTATPLYLHQAYCYADKTEAGRLCVQIAYPARIKNRNVVVPIDADVPATRLGWFKALWACTKLPSEIPPQPDEDFA